VVKTLIEYERIKAAHDAHDHSRCQFGCSPENPEPPQEAEFRQGFIATSLELASRLGRSDPRVAVAEDARAYLNTKPKLPTLILAELEGVALMTTEMISEEPDRLDLIKVRQARRLLEDCLIGRYA